MENLTRNLRSYDFTILPENTSPKTIKSTIGKRLSSMAEKPEKVQIIFAKSLPEDKIKKIPREINGVKITTNFPQTGSFDHNQIADEAKKSGAETIYIVSNEKTDDASPLNKSLNKEFGRPNIFG